MPKHNIIPQMFDIRPVDETGNLDWKKIEKMEQTLLWEIKELEKSAAVKTYRGMKDLTPQQSLRQETLNENRNNYYQEAQEANIYQLGEKVRSSESPIFYKSDFIPRIKSDPEKICKEPEKYYAREKNYQRTKKNIFKAPILSARCFIKRLLSKTRTGYFGARAMPRDIQGNFSFFDLFFPAKFNLNFRPQRTALSFASLSIIVAILIGGFAFGAKGLKIKGRILGTSQEGYSSLNSAIGSIKSQNYEASKLEFEKSYEKFSESSRDLDEMGKVFIEISKFFPFSSKLSSGKNLIEAGKHISLAGQSLNEIIKTTGTLKNPIGGEGDQNVSFLELFQSTKKEMATANSELEQTQKNIDEINIDNLPENNRTQFLSLKEKLPGIIEITNNFLNNNEIFVDLLGGNGPRKYLFLFQNNQEMRATGGFIGSYGLLDISDGRIRNFFIDGIFNPDGQLTEKIVPPKPIQKISAAWSLHDSNWFPNFPVSAKEAISFYEKTGGPTADGVIALTPTVMQKFLAITGPIEMKEYDVVINADNFIEKTQYEVEVDYDKEENKPKKILSDLAPIILDKIFNARDAKSIAMTIQALSSGLSEKHILLYSENKDLEKIISERGWSGEVSGAQKDYLNVINSNINGYKTDGVVDETISHEAQIQSDGSIVDTVTITRHHNGGNSNYEWYNKVNADYIRVYVPLGSKLLEAEGQTRETNKSPLDYNALGFKKDSSVQQEEDHMLIDENSETRIYEDSEKTVFANWTYVSPQETMTLEYKYLLPFKINLENQDKPADSYSLLAQKQSGSVGSKFTSSIKFPKNYKIEWNYPENIENKGNELQVKTKLDVDKFIGLVFTKSGAILND